MNCYPSIRLAVFFDTFLGVESGSTETVSGCHAQCDAIAGSSAKTRPPAVAANTKAKQGIRVDGWQDKLSQ
ncbi:MAG: hypothetical protein ACI9UA_005818 [Pseudoalteromonas tetraodonis]|jgi:hypothetical protein